MHYKYGHELGARSGRVTIEKDNNSDGDIGMIFISGALIITVAYLTNSSNK